MAKKKKEEKLPRTKNAPPVPKGVTRSNKCGTCKGTGTRVIYTYNRKNEITSIDYQQCEVCKGTGKQ